MLVSNSNSNNSKAKIHSLGRDGERRQLTAIFYDIVGSTSLIIYSDPEVLRDIQRYLHEKADSIFKSNGGYIDHIAGDGGCGYFGAPLPLENAAISAVSAGLELVAEIEQAKLELVVDAHIKLRIGIGTSTVVIADTPDKDWAFGHEVVGAAPVLADRLQRLAEPNTIFVCSTTHALTRTAFDYELVGAKTLKGFDGSQIVWRAIAQRPADSRFSLLRSTRSEFVSREDELQTLQGALAKAQNGEGSAFYILGEPGIGKSRLVDELLHTDTARRFEITLLQCQPRAGNQPLFPLFDYLTRRVDSSRGVGSKHGHGQNLSLSEMVPGLNPAAADILSSMIVRKSVDRSSILASAGRYSEENRTAIVAAAVEVALTLSNKHRQIFVIEDLHWADSITLNFFFRLTERSNDIPFLLIGTSRDPMPTDQVARNVIIALKLERLPFPAVKSLVHSIWSDATPSLPRTQFIFRRSEGVPLFVEEITKRLRAQLPTGTTSAADWYGVVSNEGLVSTKDILLARLAGAGSARHLAQIASTLGREFSLPIVAQLMPPETSVEQLEDQIAKLIEDELIELDGAVYERKFRFRHSLLQEVAHESLLKADLRRLHHRITELALEGVIPDMDAAVLAWHFEQANQPMRAAQFAIAAAEAHVSRSAMQEADRLLSMAQHNLSRSEACEEYTELKLRLLTVRGVVASALHGTGSAEARDAYEEGISVCSSRGREQRERWFPLYWGYWFTAPNFAIQRQRARTIVGDLATAADPETRLQAYHCAWATAFNCGQHAECLSHIDHGLTTYDAERAVQSRFRYGHDAKVCGLGERALVRWLRGNVHAASVDLSECLSWSKSIDHLGSTCHALDIAIMYHFYCRDVGRIAALAGEIGELADRHSLPGMDAKAKIFGGWARAISDGLRDGLADVREGLDILEQIGTSEDFPVYHELKAHLLGRAGKLDEAIAGLDETIEQALVAGHLFWLPELLRRRALLRKQRGDRLADFVEDARAAQVEAQRQGAASLQVRANSTIGFLMGDKEGNEIQFD